MVKTKKKTGLSLRSQKLNVIVYEQTRCYTRTEAMRSIQDAVSYFMAWLQAEGPSLWSTVNALEL